jgi:hypothetical protein
MTSFREISDNSAGLRTPDHESSAGSDGAVVEAYREEYRKLPDIALEAYRDEYREIAESWRNTESKAQGAVAIAGIFAAGVFAYTRDLAKQGTRVEKWFLAATMLLLISSVILSILALYVRRMAAPPLGKSVDIRVRHLAKVNDAEIPERLRNLKNEQAEMWRTVNEESSRANQSKAKWLLLAQVSLILAILTVGVLTVIILSS